MLKFFTSFFLVLVFTGIDPLSLQAQGLQDKALADSLLGEIPKTKGDTNQVKLYIRVVKALASTDPASALRYADIAMHLSQQYEWPKGIGSAYINKSRIYMAGSDYTSSLENAERSLQIFQSINWKAAMGDALAIMASNNDRLGDYTKAIENNFKALGIFEELNLVPNIAWTYNNIGSDYYQLNDSKNAIENYNKALVLQRKVNDKNGIASALDNMASVYEDLGEYEKVNDYNLQAIKIFEEINDQPALGRIYINRAKYYQRRNDFDSALIFYNKAITIAQKLGIKRTLAFGFGGIGELNLNVASNGYSEYRLPASLKAGKPALLQNAYDYFSRALKLSKEAGALYLMMGLTQSLSETEAMRGNYQHALDFYKQSTEYKDSIFNDDNKSKIASLEKQRLAEVKDKEIQLLNKEKALQAAQQEKKDANEKRIKNIQYFTIAALAIFVLAGLIIVSLLYRNNKHRQQANLLLQQQKEKVETTLSELKATQAQLIQSEKMASFGELTAGIAHEIQNPLNFVNNFSEVSTELIQELKNEKLRKDRDEAVENELLIDITQNLEKISFHGKRADAIVKGMLQHSRSGGSERELTDINKLADDYLKLAYHGAKAKNKSVDVTLHTHFDAQISADLLDIIPGEIARVLVNLYNNAFYAVNEKSLQAGVDEKAASSIDPSDNLSDSYTPTIWVTTKKIRGAVEIRVRDNGNGIPEKILEKVFQPFFTTKPAGQGTGLGLSLSYNIVKAHGGEIKVDTKEGAFTEFTVVLPYPSLSLKNS